MQRSRGSAVLATVILAVLTLIAAKDIQSLHKEWTFHEKEIILGGSPTAPRTTGDDELRLLYAVCDESQGQSTKSCELVSQTYGPGELSYRRSCRVSLDTGEDSRTIGRQLLLAELDGSVALAWLDREKAGWSGREVLLRVRVLEWSSCRGGEARLAVAVQHGLVDEIAFSNLVPRGDRLDVFFHGSGSACGGSATCRLGLDSAGRRIHGPEPFLPERQRGAAPLMLVLPAGPEGHLALGWTHERLRAQLVLGGDARDLLELELDGYVTFGVASLERSLALCHLPLRGDTRVSCSRVDAGSRSDVTLDLGYKVLLVRLVSLDDGGFLLLQLACTDQHCLGYKTFLVSRVRPDGSHDNRALELHGVAFDVGDLDRVRVELLRKNQREFCMTIAGPATLSVLDVVVKQPKMIYLAKCFDKRHVALD